MSLTQPAIKHLDDKYVDIITKFILDLKYRKISGSINIATATVAILTQIINKSQDISVSELCDVLIEIGRRISYALPQILVAENIIYRVLKVIRDEDIINDSLQSIVLGTPQHQATRVIQCDAIIDHITEIQNELESTISIPSSASNYINADEVILTYGASKLAEKFFRASSACFRLVIVEGTKPKYSHAMAKRLSAGGIPVTVINNATVFCFMSRVNKVVISVCSVLADGAVIGNTGVNVVTNAAKFHRVPVLALAPYYKLSPVYKSDRHLYTQSQLPYGCPETEVVHVYAPMHEVVPAHHITIFITNFGGCSPSYVYRLITELYNRKDCCI